MEYTGPSHLWRLFVSFKETMTGIVYKRASVVKKFLSISLSEFYRLVGHVDYFLSLYSGSVFVLCMVLIVLILYLLLWESNIFQVLVQYYTVNSSKNKMFKH